MCHSVYWPESNNEHKLKPTIQSCYPPNRSGEKHLCVCKHGRMPVRVCLCVCACLKVPVVLAQVG